MRTFKPVVVITPDQTLYDFLGRTLGYLNRRWGLNLTVVDVKGQSLAGLTGSEEIDRDLLCQIRNPQFYWRVQPYPEAKAALELLRKHGYGIEVVTGRPVRRVNSTGTAYKNHAYITNVIFERDFPGLIDDVQHTQVRYKVATVCRKHPAFYIENHPRIAEEVSQRFIQTFWVWRDDRHPTCPDGVESNGFLIQVPTVLDAAKCIVKGEYC